MLSDLSLFVATRLQIEESRRRSYPQWGRGMSPEAWAERHERIDKAAVAAEDRLTTWVLAPRDDPETLDFMCACKTFRREVFVTRSDSSTVEVGYGIASVFTPPENRGKGYAKHMTRLLHWVLAKPDTRPSKFPVEWGEPPVQVEGFMNGSVSVLYSDVGTEFYLACGFLPGSHDGWRVAPRAATIWKVSGGSPSQVIQQQQCLGIEELEGFWERDSAIIEQEMKDHRHQDSDAAFSFAPRSGLAAFHPLRLQNFIEDKGPKPTFYGVALQSEEELAYASWTFEFSSFTKLIITRVRVPKAKFKELMSAIMDYCEQQEIEEIEAWNLSDELVQEAGSMGATTADLEDHLPSVKWYTSRPNERVKWVNNEKFCWC
ncbi:hypothetical protein BKA70DRAFT_568086 [Coprinopsis sp. MPI-PUGE-AT-0042]|nr:hypothetical protein BKA70DRAFT_568086 [Coprinopsis sp. MPI-PUGE-AT-0042]